MSEDDVHPDDMHELTPDELEQLLDGPTEFGDHPVAASFDRIAGALRAVDAPTPGPALAEFLETAGAPAPEVEGDRSEAVVVPMGIRRTTSKKEKKKMIGSMAAFAATTGGRVLLGTAAAAAAFGGAEVTGVVDVVGGPEPTEVVVESTSSADGGAATDAGVDGESSTPLRIAAGASGSFVVTVEGDAVLLTEIASADGWTGSLTGDGDGDVQVTFRSDDGSAIVRGDVTLAGDFLIVEITEGGVTLQTVASLDGSIIQPPTRVELPVSGGGRLDLDARAQTQTQVEVDGPVDVQGDVRAEVRIDAGADAQVPAVEVPTVEVPTVEVPTVEVPAVEVPAVEVPTVEVPTVEVPAVEVPTVEVPTVEVPAVELPDAPVPTIPIPEVEVPEVEVDLDATVDGALDATLGAVDETGVVGSLSGEGSAVGGLGLGLGG